MVVGVRRRLANGAEDTMNDPLRSNAACLLSVAALDDLEHILWLRTGIYFIHP
jgi:hypothetical protein